MNSHGAVEEDHSAASRYLKQRTQKYETCLSVFHLIAGVLRRTLPTFNHDSAHY